MCVEMLLKLHGMVGGGYYKLQNCYRNANVGFGPYRNATIRRLQFYEKNFDPSLAGFGEFLMAEYRAGRSPVISLFSYRKDDVLYFHEWLVYGRRGSDFLIVSKNGKGGTDMELLAPRLGQSPHTNLLAYCILPD